MAEDGDDIGSGVSSGDDSGGQENIPSGGGVKIYADSGGKKPIDSMANTSKVDGISEQNLNNQGLNLQK